MKKPKMMKRKKVDFFCVVFSHWRVTSSNRDTSSFFSFSLRSNLFVSLVKPYESRKWQYPYLLLLLLSFFQLLTVMAVDPFSQFLVIFFFFLVWNCFVLF